MVAVQGQAHLRLRMRFTGTSNVASDYAGDRDSCADNILGAGALSAEEDGASRPRFYHTQIQDHALGHRQGSS